MARTLRKEEFITDGKIIINVTSANQQKIVNEKAVTKLLALSQTILPSLKSEYSVNTFLRTLVDKSGVE
jgi:ureidoglycolate hydrolase